MASQGETDSARGGGAPLPATDHSMQVGLRLRPAQAAEQHLFSNFTAAQAERGTVFVDFGFLDPAALNTVIRAAESGAPVPETINGQLVCRVALAADTAAQLARQLNAVLSAGKLAVVASADRATTPANRPPR